MIKPTPNPPIDPAPSVLFTVKDGICTQDLLVNLSESLASAHALTFDLDGSRREGALGIAQLIEVSRLLAERVLADIER
ncbi:DUF6124 family protein [Pseudomonas synxantha]|uniref:DUF3077 domain-containing protein n=1 Tax=Pseudomonas synxantha TaxID=47883 RepID=A0ABS0UQ61_9PSED|nr:hypothetical protein [Pseudomonas synxantha]MBI6567738.1 hypothetical protein [Pseudomonas synxantha]MBI6583668.1 hypothetical protein [Pseudomonas synxantha]MBI6646307.1 hypothetical protein [Pseudomonas synxantha]